MSPPVLTPLPSLSIPFIGIFALHPPHPLASALGRFSTFNSLYWDFCFASTMCAANTQCIWLIFQFPLLGFLLCIIKCHLLAILAISLSIPFIGIFALHPEDVERLEKRAKPFNSLYWDFCFASPKRRKRVLVGKVNFQFPLLGFLLCIVLASIRVGAWRGYFQFPLLGFLLCIKKRATVKRTRS